MRQHVPSQSEVTASRGARVFWITWCIFIVSSYTWHYAIPLVGHMDAVPGIPIIVAIVAAVAWYLRTTHRKLWGIVEIVGGFSIALLTTISASPDTIGDTADLLGGPKGISVVLGILAAVTAIVRGCEKLSESSVKPI
jgi:hypothetical protein